VGSRIDTDHPLVTVLVNVHVDGVLKESFDLPTGLFFENNYTFPFRNDSKPITAEVTSSGGATGATSDSRQARVLKDRAMKVDLQA